MAKTEGSLFSDAPRPLLTSMAKYALCGSRLWVLVSDTVDAASRCWHRIADIFCYQKG